MDFVLIPAATSVRLPCLGLGLQLSNPIDGDSTGRLRCRRCAHRGNRHGMATGVGEPLVFGKVDDESGNGTIGSRRPEQPYDRHRERHGQEYYGRIWNRAAPERQALNRGRGVCGRRRRPRYLVELKRRSPISRARSLGSFCRQRFRSRNQFRRCDGGSADHSGSPRTTAAIISVASVAVEGAPAGEHLEQHAAERPDVGALVDVLPRACSGAM